MMIPPHPGDTPTEDITAQAGIPLPPDQRNQAPEEPIVAQLRTVHDPEIPVNIYDLGLIYTIDRKDDGAVDIIMTVTAPACPVAGELPGQVAHAVADVAEVGEVSVRLTWEPPWTPDLMSEEAKLALDMY